MSKRASKTKSHSVAIKPLAAGCGCGVMKQLAQLEAVPGTGPGAHAVGVEPQIKEANQKHLRRIEGQVRGIASMISEERYCTDIITQISAVRESLHAVARNLLRNHLTHCATIALQEGGDKKDRMTEELLDLVGKLSR